MTNTPPIPPTRCGTVALMGAPNAGKSTLLNAMVGQKLAIISPKPQTTRARLRGIVMHGDSQLVFVDTPGVFAAKSSFEKSMVHAAWSGFSDCDVALVIVDAGKGAIDERTQKLLADLKLRNRAKPLWLVLNKTDILHGKEKLLLMVDELQKDLPFEKIFMVSATKGQGVQDVIAALAAAMPEAPYLFDKDDVTDTPQRILAAELTREQLFLQLAQEVPYGLTVETEAWENFDNGSVKITQLITVSRDSHKGIVIGNKGARLKEIGARARLEMKESLGFDVHLFLHVKVKEDWQDNPEYYESMGLEKK